MSWNDQEAAYRTQCSRDDHEHWVRGDRDEYWPAEAPPAKEEPAPQVPPVIGYCIGFVSSLPEACPVGWCPWCDEARAAGVPEPPATGEEGWRHRN